LGVKFTPDDRYPGEILPWAGEALGKALLNRTAGEEHDRDRRRHLLGCPRRRGPVRDDRIHSESDELNGKFLISHDRTVRVSRFDDEITPLNPSGLLQHLTERGEGKGFGLGGKPSDLDRRRLLRSGGERPTEKAADAGSDERPSIHYSST